MNRRSFLSSLIITPAVAAMFAACGDDRQVGAPRNTGAADTVPPTALPTLPPVTAAPAPTYPTGAGDVVLRLGYEGGFTMQGASFTFPPTLLISGDGRMFTPGVQTAIYPGPLLMPVTVRTITPAGITALLQLADQAGLLAPPPDYTAEIPVADVGNTVVTLGANGGTFVHSAFALGMDLDASGKQVDGLTPQRAKLKQFVDMLGDITKVVGAENLGPEGPFSPDAYRFQAYVIDPAAFAVQDPAPTFVEWPASIGVRLADATQCATATVAAAGSLFTEAKQNTYFTEGGVTYAVAVGGVLPGDPPC